MPFLVIRMWASSLIAHAISIINMPIESLPKPDSIAQEHSEKLQSLIADRIGEEQCSFADFMQYALYEPGLGYYMAGAQKFGEQGDFITAPELSPLFGQSIAHACRSLFTEVPANILELGAGSGKLAQSVIASMSDVRQLRYWILEPSAELQHRQQQYLQSSLSAQQFASVSWLSTLPTGFSGVVLANEVMDALPVERVQFGNTAQQQCVKHTSFGFETYTRDAPAHLRSEIERLQRDLDEPLPQGYQSEIALLLGPWIAALATTLDKGAALLIDYGYPRREYYATERTQGTLSCYYQHHMHEDVYWWPGLQDITAHVDFTRVIENAAVNDLELLGYTSQASFLLDNALMDHLQTACDQCSSDLEQLRLSQAVKKLTLPGEMGERFQVMALGKGMRSAPSGFALQELSYRL